MNVPFNSLCSYTTYTTAIITEVQSRNKIVNSLADSAWGNDKETLLGTYKTIGSSIINYATLIWSLGCSRMHMKNIQTCQNTAVRTITGCLLIFPIEHMHNVTCMLPIKEHNELLSKQYLLGCFPRNHLCSLLLEAESPPRNIKTIFLQCIDEVQHFTDQISDATNFRQGLNAIHSGVINTFTYSLSVNGVLGDQPPPIVEQKLELPRESRITLAQLCSRYCKG